MKASCVRLRPFVAVGLVACLTVGPGARPLPAQPQPRGDKPQAITPYERNLLLAQIGLFKGDYALAYDRIERATKDADDIPDGDDSRKLAQAVCDTLRAEVHNANGYFAEAHRAFEMAEKKLTKRAVFWAQKGANKVDLAMFNFRLGYVYLCMGDNALAREHVDSIIQDRPLRDTATNHYQKGINFIHGVINAGGTRVDANVAQALLNRCDLRMARALALNGDAIGAAGHFKQAETFLKNDRRWIRQFDPNGPQAKALPGQNVDPGGAAGPQAKPDDREAMELARIALSYIDLLNIESEIHLASDPPQPHLAEAAASLARDIAEERFPGTAVYWQSLVTLARAYCMGYKVELQKLAADPDAVVQINGEVVNVHQKAAETYTFDVEDLIRRSKEASKDLNPRRPIHFHILDVERTLAKDRKDGQELLRLKSEGQRLADSRAGDKPPARQSQ